MFEKIVAIEPVGLIAGAKERLNDFAKEVVQFDRLPGDDAEIIRRIGDADAVLVSYTSKISKEVIAACPNLRYVGMCCSLYSEESANVDIAAARACGVTVKGIRDYGDPGVVECVLSELIRYLHGFGEKRWLDQPVELTEQKVGIVGLGTTGSMIAAALCQLGADVCYYSRTRKAEEEEKGVLYRDLRELLEMSDVVCTCLTRNTVLLHEEEFARLGSHKILFNTSIGPGHDPAALEKWLASGDNEFFCDTVTGLGDRKLLVHPHVNCAGTAAGTTKQSAVRLGNKVLNNIEAYLQGK